MEGVEEEYLFSAPAPGTHWRGNPETGCKPQGDLSNWPRTGAILRGVMELIDNRKWLGVNAIKQAGSEEWQNVEDFDYWIPISGG